MRWSADRTWLLALAVVVITLMIRVRELEDWAERTYRRERGLDS